MSTLEYCEAIAKHERSSLKNMHSCKLCIYSTASFFLMTNHVKRHRFPLVKFTCDSAKIEPYYCIDCDFKTELIVLFKEHIYKYHGLKRESTDDLLTEDFHLQTYVCEKFSFETNLSLKWLQHTSACTGKKKKIQSVTSPKQYDAYRFTIKQATDICWYHCTECSYKTKFKYNLNRHIRKHNVNKPYACDKCPYTTNYNASLRQHINIHLDNQDVKWHECEKCPLKTKTEDTLIRHIKTLHMNHENFKWYECTKCSFKTKHRSSLDLHVAGKHLDEEKIRWYECQICTFKTKQMGSLKSHITYRHLDKEEIKWYRCDDCSYKCKSAGDLRKHVKVHLDIRSYECGYCPYQAKHSQVLDRHINTHHLDDTEAKWYKCEHCPYKSKNDSAFYRHRKRKHV
ncbi:hypothetical protein Zmor_017553 [Zophobas morio]|uniref:Protein hunchback n=1 Tax=Zophobas morio TaxID=2755281 RepID=A0AA38MCT5_9CUCU|nr:hypothetical protein Zmor_017553 [Zophobas morio]